MNRQRKRAIIAVLAVISVAWTIFCAVACVACGLLQEWFAFGGTPTLSLYNLPGIGYWFWAMQSASVLNAGLLYWLWLRTGRDDVHR